MQGHANCDDSLDMTYLPILLGYWYCYKWYMALIGCVVRMPEFGAFIVMGGGGKEIDAGEYCSFPTYFNLWKRGFPDLNVSRPVEDICKDCYAFANPLRCLANHTMGQDDDDGNSNSNGKGKRSNDGHSNDGNNNDGSNDL